MPVTNTHTQFQPFLDVADRIESRISGQSIPEGDHAAMIDAIRTVWSDQFPRYVDYAILVTPGHTTFRFLLDNLGECCKYSHDDEAVAVAHGGFNYHVIVPNRRAVEQTLAGYGVLH